MRRGLLAFIALPLFFPALVTPLPDPQDGGEARTLEACRDPASEIRVHGGTECLRIETYLSAGQTAHPRLAVFLHGDFDGPSYHYEMAKLVAAQNDDLVTVGLLRPGYTDASGNRSTGTRGTTGGDNYTPEVVDAVAASLRSLAEAHHTDGIVLIGHSGGAAIAANLIGRHPGLVDAAVLASCPCDVPRWRAHIMKERLGGRVWDEAVRSLSPHLLADGIGRETLVRIVVGVEDDNTLPAYSREYAGRLRRLGSTSS